MIFLWVPETKQRTLEELDYVFAVSTRTYMKYQLTEALPYFFKRWVFFNKNAKLEPLYRFDTVSEAAEVQETNTLETQKMGGEEKKGTLEVAENMKKA